ncbi:MAG: hypothetical protein NZ951_05005 [Dehalococcoidia bacterium]|nr:hypothetical protein [Dehalococcoidia bacterium]MDW8120653.1 hypothetical protein [Chloroflexota bacterium]
MDITVGEHHFQVIVRTNTLLPHDYSIVLLYTHPQYGAVRLRRYHGPLRTAHENDLEGEIVPAGQPHIHKATQRYGEKNPERHDHYAVLAHFTSLEEAWEQFIQECALQRPPGDQLPLPLGG